MALIEQRLAGQGVVQGRQPLFQEAAEDIVEPPEGREPRLGQRRTPRCMFGRLAVEAIHDYLQPGQLHGGLGRGEPG